MEEFSSLGQRHLTPGMIRLQDVDLVDACRYKVGGKGVTPYSGLGFRVRGLVCMVALACYFFDLVILVTFLVSFSPFAMPLMNVLFYFTLLFLLVP